MTGDEHLPSPDPPRGDVEWLLDRAVAGVPRWRRARTRRELAAYVDDAYADLLREGVEPAEAVCLVRARFGDPDAIAADFRALPPPRWARPAQRGVAPAGVLVLGLVLGLALVQLHAPAQPSAGPAPLAETVERERLERLHVREVRVLQAPTESLPPGAAELYPISRRLGATPAAWRALEPSVQALTPAWLPEGYDPGGAQLLITPSTTLQYFADTRGERPGIMVEVLRPDRSTVFQVKERHIRPVWVGDRPGFYIDGEWEVRGPRDEQPAPATWRTDRSRSVLFAWDDLIVLVTGPADLLETDLLRIARSLQPS